MKYLNIQDYMKIKVSYFKGTFVLCEASELNGNFKFTDMITLQLLKKYNDCDKFKCISEQEKVPENHFVSIKPINILIIVWKTF